MSRWEVGELNGGGGPESSAGDADVKKLSGIPRGEVVDGLEGVEQTRCGWKTVGFRLQFTDRFVW